MSWSVWALSIAAVQTTPVMMFRTARYAKAMKNANKITQES
eukprot:CAMPEP_0172694818 /NCGR_PEP_ID=MMETSP1074-20121228/26928_1 /TAXON_ID=2916 /ORGANISM="Ceratium fusus, Strain PA161109" /LENGTH=40 /DNA_ID= /DNA_START= /DNA_END= /DNA_ORIENTATION=